MASWRIWGEAVIKFRSRAAPAPAPAGHPLVETLKVLLERQILTVRRSSQGEELEPEYDVASCIANAIVTI
jgi:hypothetical protein